MKRASTGERLNELASANEVFVYCHGHCTKCDAISFEAEERNTLHNL